MHQTSDTVFGKLRTNIIAFFGEQLSRQIVEHTRHRLYKLAERGFNGTFADPAALETAKATLSAELDVAAIYESIRIEFEGYVQANDYRSILRVFNNKGITARSQVANLCNIANGGYHNYIFEEIMLNTAAGNAIRAIVRANIN